MYEFEGGTKAWKVVSLLKLIIEDPEDGKFEISGFNDSAELDSFLEFGDFNNTKDNLFFVCTMSKTKLLWTALD